MLLAYAFLPRTVFLLPFAAFFVLLCAVLFFRGGAARAWALCLFFGAGTGLALLARTDASLARVQGRYAGRTVRLTAEVESVSDSYYDGAVRAVLLVRQAQGEAAAFRAECAALPECEAGELISGRFSLEVPSKTRLIESCADGVALIAEYEGGFTQLEESGSFRARTSRIQRALSESLRRLLDENTGGVLAAMVLGDRLALPSAMNSAYRAAGLSHVLVVSGMHVSLLCGDILPHPKRREISYARRRLKALWRAVLALGLVGVTGFTPSVLRAAVAVWVSALGVWVYGPPDALTSLAAAGFLMSVSNAYAVCDVGFELSFAAVLGTLAGGELARRGREAHAKKRVKTPIRPTQRLRIRLGGWLWDTLCVSSLASAATFPVLVLRGLSASLYALLSSVAVLWLVEPMMLLGLAASAAGLVPFAKPLHYVFSFGAGLTASIMNAWACMVASWPGAQLYFDTNYAAVVCLLLLGLYALAVRWRVRARVAVPALLLGAVLALGAGSTLNRGVVRVELVGSVNTPCVVITQGESAAVLFRGGAAAQQDVETLLARRGVREAELVIDMRLSPASECTLPARRTISAANQRACTSKNVAASPGGMTAEIYRTASGCAVLLEIDGRRFAAVSGTVALAKPARVDWLLASPASPEAFRWENTLSLSGRYRWQDGEESYPSSLALRVGGGVREGN